MRVLRPVLFFILAVVGAIAALDAAINKFPAQVASAIPAIASFLPPELPAKRLPSATYWLDQNWSNADRFWFHHASQGTATLPVPYAWFMALEQPEFSIFRQPGLFSESSYLQRFGFIPSPKSLNLSDEDLRGYGYSKQNKTPNFWPATGEASSVLKRDASSNADSLPVGFARTVALSPVTGQPMPDQVGLTCAACHTRQLEYKGVSLLIDGGPAMIDLYKLQQAISASLLYTVLPVRFSNFADRVLGRQASFSDRFALWRQLFTGIISAISVQTSTPYDKVEGFGRLDALDRIGNQVFHNDVPFANEHNLAPLKAPVAFPPIWTLPWFKWAQYDASIENPLVRNVGEALGVRAELNLTSDNPQPLFRSTVNLNNIVWIEDMLRGGDPFASNPKSFSGLRSPKWPGNLLPADSAWKIDPARVTKGRVLYAELCAECHLGPVNDPAFDKAYPDKSFWSASEWQSDGHDRTIQLVEKSVAGMGTDPEQSKILATHTVDLPVILDINPARDLGKKWGCQGITTSNTTSVRYAFALMILVDRVVDRWLDDHSIDKSDRSIVLGTRRNCPNPSSEPVYRARPLNGVWAIAPYLHNGSVPSIYWLLQPAVKRPKSFCIGASDFDPKQMGYDASPDTTAQCKSGESRFESEDDSGQPVLGNSNAGHSFEGPIGPDKPGVIGRLLNDEERYDLIEYLKTL